MARKVSIIFILVLLSIPYFPASAQSLEAYSPNVVGYQGCIIAEDQNGFLYSVVNAQSMSIYIPKGGVALRFWIWSQSGFGIAPIIMPGSSQPTDAFSPWSPDGTVNWILPIVGENLLLNTSAIYVPPEIPDRVRYAAAICPQAVPVSNVVAPVLQPVQNILNCETAPFTLKDHSGEAVCFGNSEVTIETASLEVDGRPRPEVIVHSWDVAGAKCFSWKYQAFQDSVMYLMFGASDGFIYPYPVNVVTENRVNDADTMLCRYSEDLATVDPILGDFTRGLIFGLGVSPTDELVDDFVQLNGDRSRYLNHYLVYDVPQSWIDLYYEEGWGSK